MASDPISELEAPSFIPDEVANEEESRTYAPPRRDAHGYGESHSLVMVGDTERTPIVVNHFPFRIGSSRDCDLLVSDPRVALEHARLVRQVDGVYIVDDDSPNGTYVNGRRIRRERLVPNSRILFGTDTGENAAHLAFLYDAGQFVDDSARQFLSMLSAQGSVEEHNIELEAIGIFVETTRELSRSFNTDDILQNLLEAAIHLVDAERGFVFSSDLGRLAGRDKSGSAAVEDRGVSLSILRETIAKGYEFMATDSGQSHLLENREDVVSNDLQKVICMPLSRWTFYGQGPSEDQQAKRHGFLYLDSRHPSNPISALRKDILRTLVGTAVTATESISLTQVQDAAVRYRQELALAGEIQQRLMTVTIPDVPFAQVKVLSYPHKEVGGDFFDLVYTEKGLSLINVDVSGKGVSAAVVAAILQGMLYSQLARDSSLSEIMVVANRFLCEKVGGQKYATLVVARLESNGDLEMINCGHVPPLLISNGSAVAFEEGNLPIGLVPMAEFQTVRLHLKPGDRFLTVTDGATEAENAEGEFFGTDRLKSVSVKGFAEIERAIEEFRDGTPLTDDFTMTELIYTG